MASQGLEGARGITRGVSARRWEGDGFEAQPKPAKDVTSCVHCCYVRCATLIICVGGMPWPNTGAISTCTVKVSRQRSCNQRVGWDLEPMDLRKGLALCCYQPSPGLLIV